MYLVATTKPYIVSEYKTDIVFLNESLEGYTTDLTKAKTFTDYEEAQLESREDMNNGDFVLPVRIAKLIP